MDTTYGTRLGYFPGTNYTIPEEKWGRRNGMFMTFRAMQTQNLLTYDNDQDEYRELIKNGVEDFNEAVKLGFVDC